MGWLTLLIIPVRPGVSKQNMCCIVYEHTKAGLFYKLLIINAYFSGTLLLIIYSEQQHLKN